MIRLFSLILMAILGATSASAAVTNPSPADDSPTSRTLYPAPGSVRIVETTAEVAELLPNHGADLLVVNFWATWCAPCVEELPYFVTLAKKYPQSQVRVVGLSLDLPEQVESGVIPFLKKREIPYSNLIVYTDDAQEMIELFSKDWSGELPATFFYDRKGKKLGEIPFQVTEAQLNAAVEALLAGKPIPTMKRE